MPDGKNHNIINITVLIVLLSGVFALFKRYDVDLFAEYLYFQSVLLFSIFYLFGTFFLSPDLDIQSTPYERWGPFKFLWWPYKVLFKHRGLSHNPVFGPLTIIINFGLIFVPLLVLAGFEFELVPIGLIVPFMMGILTSIELHILADVVVSELN